MWDTIAKSGLVTATQLASLKSEYERALAAGSLPPTQSLDQWLVHQDLITPYQSRIIAAGRPGPFQFGRYVVYEKSETGALAGTFRAVEPISDHHLRLVFVPGHRERDVVRWQELVERAAKWSAVRHPFLVPVFESVAIGQYRFLVFDDPPGKTLYDKLPQRGRLPWLQACQVGEQIASGLAQIHQQGITHGQICTAAIWIQSGGTGRVMWPTHLELNQPGDQNGGRDDAKVDRTREGGATDWMHGFQSPLILAGGARTPRTDAFSFGAVMFRMLTGKLPTIDTVDIDCRTAQVDSLLASCEKYELPSALSQWLPLLLTADVSNQLRDMTVGAKLIATILGSQSLAKDHESNPPSLRKFESVLAGNLPTPSAKDRRLKPVGGPGFELDASTGRVAASGKVDDLTARNGGHLAVKPAIQSHVGRRAKGKNRWIPLFAGGAVIVSAVVVGLLLSGKFAKPNSSSDRVSGTVGNQSKGNDEQKSLSLSGQNPEALAVKTDPGDLVQSQYLVQRLVDDDGELLWESPTSGPPIIVDRIPAAPDFIFAFGWQNLSQSEQAKLFLKSLGPEFEQLQQQFRSFCNVDFARIDTVIVSLHSSDDGKYEGFFQFNLAQPIPLAELAQKLGDAKVESHSESGQRIWHNNGSYFYFWPLAENELIKSLFISSRDLIEQSISNSGEDLVGGALARLVARSDATRDFTMIYRPAALVTEEASWLFGGRYSALRRPLHLFFDDRVQAVMFSIHFEDASYLEIAVEQSVDLPSKDLAEKLVGNFRGARDRVINHIDGLPDHPFWSKIRLRLDNMVLELYRNTRVGVESGRVMVNCWLPPMAIHNLVASSELALASSQFTDTPTKSSPGSHPATLGDLLDRPRSISVTSGPDLINLLNDIVTEVKEDYPNLAFEFEIKIQGNDLLKHGITQNQRPGDVIVQNTPLRDILTQIMFQANPDKDASSPRDPRCKLVWVIGNDPENSERRLIFVTTRQAATEQNLTLPKTFQPE